MKTLCEEIVLFSLSLTVGKVSISLGGSKLLFSIFEAGNFHVTLLL